MLLLIEALRQCKQEVPPCLIKSSSMLMSAFKDSDFLQFQLSDRTDNNSKLSNRALRFPAFQYHFQKAFPCYENFKWPAGMVHVPKQYFCEF